LAGLPGSRKRPRRWDSPAFTRRDSDNGHRLSQVTGIRHHLVAILAADAAGYSRLMVDDEHATVLALDRARDVFRKAAEADHGRIVDTAGDSVLVVFETAAGAVRAALQIQQALKESSREEASDRRLCFRIGVHLGDVLEKDDGSIYGEGVNIAARLQELALPGGVVVSDSVRSSIRSRLPATFLDLGDKTVKNMAEPVHAFRVTAGGGPNRPERISSIEETEGLFAAAAHAWRRVPLGIRRWLLATMCAVVVGVVGVVGWMRLQLPVATSRSIAVLPFVDMSENHDQEYFSDGLSEELIDHLTNAPGLKVIARTSSFQFKGKNEDMRVIAQKLGVANLLEGSVRKSGDDVRITVQLIRATDGTHIWSQTYDRNFSDIFKIQDEIARTVADSLRVALQSNDSHEGRPANTQAYNLLLEGDFFARRNTKPDTEHAIGLYKDAIALDPNYARAWARLADAYGGLGWFGLANVDGQREAIAQALRADPESPDAYGAKAYLLKYHDWDWSGAEAALRRANELAPNPRLDEDLAEIGWMFGRLDDSIAAHRRRLVRDPLSANAYWGLGLALFMEGRYTDAESAFRKVSELNTSYASAEAFLALVLLYQGRGPEALLAVNQEPDASWKAQALPIIYWGLGRRDDSDAALGDLTKAYSATSAYQIAEVHAYRGEPEAAFQWLETAYRQRDPGMTWIRVDPLLQSLRGDPRYHAFLVKMKLDAGAELSPGK
jgi:adenylate cyclase